MRKKEITIEELEAFIIDFKNTFSDVDMAVEINFIRNDVDMDSAFYEVKSELDAILNPIKNAKE
jgi:hypothetical protein